MVVLTAHTTLIGADTAFVLLERTAAQPMLIMRSGPADTMKPHFQCV
jgi:hypothetical protein